MHFYLQVADRVGYLCRGGESVGRAHGEVAGGRGAPPHDHRGNDIERETVRTDHRAEGGDRHCADHQATHWTAQVGQARERHRRGDGQLEDGEARVEAGEFRRGGRPAEEPSSASSRRHTASAANPATPIWRTAVSRGTSRPTRTSVTITPKDPRNHRAVISQSIPEGGGVTSSVTWISKEVLAWTSGMQIATSTVAMPTRDSVGGTSPGGATSAGPQKEGTDALVPGRVPDVVRNGRQLCDRCGRAHIFMSDVGTAVLCPEAGPGEGAPPPSWPGRDPPAWEGARTL